MAYTIGQKVRGKIWSGPDYGFQSPSTYNKLKESGALKLGASQIRRTSQLLQRAAQRLPQPVKDVASNVQQFYATAGERENQRLLDRGFTQQQIDESNAFVERFSKSGDATQRAIQSISDRTNIAPEIVQGAALLAEVAIEGLAGRAMARRTLQGASRAPAPPAYAMGRDKFQGPIPPPQQGPRQFLSPVERDAQVRAGISQKVEDIRAGRATPAQSSINKASDKSALEKAAAAARNSRTSNRVQGDGVILPTKGDSTTAFNRLNSKGEVVSSSRGGGEPTRQAPPKTSPSYKPTPQIKDKAIRDKVAELKRQRAQHQQKNVDRFFSGDGTAETFPSKKGADVRTRGSRVEGDNSQDFADDVASSGLVNSDSDGFTVIDGERTGGGRGKPGATKPVANNIQQQHFSEVVGKDLSKLSRTERRSAVLSYIAEEKDIDLRSLSSKDKNRLLSEFIKENTLSDQAIRDRAQRYNSERRFPEQFNQLEAEGRGAGYEATVRRERPDGKSRYETRVDSGGVELPARDRNTADRKGRKTRQAGSRSNPTSTDSRGKEVVNPDRDYVLGKGSKPREGNKLPKNLSVRERIRQRTQTNETSRSDNIPGGRRIKQSAATYKQRIKEARDRQRARGMSSFQGKRSYEEVVRADEKARQSANKQGVKHNTRLPETKPGVAEQQFHYSQPRKLTADEKRLMRQEESNRSVVRTLEQRIKSRQSFDKSAGPVPTEGNKGRNRRDPVLDAERAADEREAVKREATRQAKAEQNVTVRRGREVEKKPKPPIAKRARTKAEERRLVELSVKDPEAFKAELEQFVRDNVPQDRFVSPQDGLRNPNPFTSSGEMRGVRAVQGNNPTVGEGALIKQIRSYGDPAQGGRSQRQTRDAKALIERVRQRVEELRRRKQS